MTAVEVQMAHDMLAYGTSAPRRSSASSLLVAFAAVLLISAAPQKTTVEEPPAAGAAVDQAEWKALLLQMRAVQLEHQLADSRLRPELEAEYARLVSRGEVLAATLQAELERTYRADPKPGALADYLAGVALLALENDNYEEASRLMRMLMDRGYPAKALAEKAAMAAYALSDYEANEKFLRTAAKEKALSPAGEAYLAELSDHDMRENWRKERAIRAAEAKDDDLPRVLLKTNRGDITLELFENEAPNTVANFIGLVEKKFYDGLTFHRVLSGFMAQGGCPRGDGKGGPGYSIPCECYQDNYRRHYRGSLSMANLGRDTGGSQFFITFRPIGKADGTSNLNGKHTVFGRVIDGMDVLSKIRRRNPDGEEPPPPDTIISATVVRKRSHPYEPVHASP